MPTYNGFNLVSLALGAGLLSYGLYVLIAPFISDGDKKLSSFRIGKGLLAIIIGGLFLYSSPVDADESSSSHGGYYWIVRLVVIAAYWGMMRHYDPMSRKRESGAFSKR
jgi:hypothetical protein